MFVNRKQIENLKIRTESLRSEISSTLAVSDNKKAPICIIPVSVRTSEGLRSGDPISDYTDAFTFSTLGPETLASDEIRASRMLSLVRSRIDGLSSPYGLLVKGRFFQFMNRRDKLSKKASFQDRSVGKDL